MEKRSKLRSAVAGVLIVAMLAAVPFALLYDDGSGENDRNMPDTAVLYFDGVTLALSDDGGIQAFMDVYVKPNANYANTFMYTFFLKFNDRLWHPSDHATNATTGAVNFFEYNDELFKVQASNGTVTSVNPFEIDTAVGRTTGNETIPNMMYASISLDRDTLFNYFDGSYTTLGSVKQGYAVGEDNYNSNIVKEDYFYYLEDDDSSPLGIKLGTLSFRVADQTGAEADDREVLRELTENWDDGFYYWYDNDSFTPTLNAPNGDDVTKDDDTSNDPPLFVDTTDTENAITGPEYTYPWGIGYYTMYSETIETPVGEFTTDIYSTSTAGIPDDAAAIVSYEFGRELITAKPLREDVVINAYQAYTYEGPDFAGDDVALAKYNLAIALGKYAPTVEASYVDSRVENFTLNWGAANNAAYEHDFTIYEKITVDETTLAGYVGGEALPEGHILRGVDVDGDGTPDNYAVWQDITTINNYEYDPTEGEYIATQYLYYPSENADGTVDTLKYPTPMEVHLTVTPVKVVSVSGEPLDRIYTHAYASGLSFDALQLPDEILLNTDVVSGAASLHLEIGSELPVWTPSTLDDISYEDGSGTTVKWPNSGTYKFAIGTLVEGTGATDIGDEHHRAISAVYGTEISEKYPWLTVEPSYEISASRTVLPADSDVHTDYKVEYVSTSANDYQMITDGDYTNDALTLNLRVIRNGNGEQSFNQDSTAFRIRLPDGMTVIDTALLNGAGLSDYETIYSETDASVQLRIVPGVTSTADSAKDETEEQRAHRETIRRWINLGGYYGVSICENVGDEAEIWTEFYTVYVDPRPNYYEQDKTYNFIGLNAGLINYAGMFSDTVTLPEGEYRPVRVESETIDDNGTVTTHNPNTLKTETESYGVMTTYDAMTGAQPGEVFTFRVTRAAGDEIWKTETPDETMASVLSYFNNAEITRYNIDENGANVYAEMIYDAYGRVTNPTEAVGTVVGDDKRPYEPVIRVEADAAAAVPLESVRLIYEGDPAPNNIITTPSIDGRYDEVNKVVFDTETVGYTVRQSFELTIVNDGDTDVDGLYIDSMLDYFGEDYASSEYWRDNGGAHFEITDPPASFLPAGGKTTFTVTYVFNLKVLEGTVGTTGEIFNYLDKLYVCSNAHGPGELAEFDATFRVEEAEVNRVTVIVLPPFEDDKGNIFYLGEAGVIAGKVGDDMDYTYDSTMRVSGRTVYIGTFPYEEYSVKTVYSNDAGVIINNTGGFEDVYDFTMPGHSVTIYVVFEETTRSKLRPDEINVYAAEDATVVADRDPDARDETRKTLWQKSFTDEEIDAATEDEEVNDLTLMNGGAAAKSGYDASTEHYLVVLEQNEAYVQSDVILREVKALYTAEMAAEAAANAAASADGLSGNVTYDALVEAGYNDSYVNENIEGISIVMEVYSSKEDGTCDNNSKVTVYDSTSVNEEDVDKIFGGDIDADGYTDGLDAHFGSTAARTKHTSEVFEAPADGARKWLVITLSHADDGGTTTERSYYIELVRRPSHSVTVAYGNSPAGMIYNTDGFVEDGMLNDAGRASLKLFAENRDFSQHETDQLPYAFSHSEISQDYNYNREAWITYGQLYDPDSLTYTASYSIGIGGTDTDGDGDVDELDIHENYNDLDLDPYSLFVILDGAFVDPGLIEIEDSSMRIVDPERVTRYIKDAVYVSAANGDGSYISDKGYFELVREGKASQTGDIYLGTLAEDACIAGGFWQATHDYRQGYQSVDGKEYPRYIYVDKDTGAVEHYFYQTSSGNYFELDSPHITIDNAKIPYLKPYLVDYDNTAVALRPGVYEMVYEFDDFDSTETDEPLRVTRKIVILGPTGDATADGSVTNGDPQSDETAIEKRVGIPLGYEQGFEGANAFKFRTVDVNNDRNVNNIDANELHSNLNGLVQMYEPVYYKDGVTVPSGTEVGA